VHNWSNQEVIDNIALNTDEMIPYAIECFFKMNATTYHMLEIDIDELIINYD